MPWRQLAPALEAPVFRVCAVGAIGSMTVGTSDGVLRSRLVGGRPAVSRLATMSTIRGKVWAAALAITLVSVACGAYAILGIRNAGTLVGKTFDQSLMSVNFARAAAADFANMQAAFARRMLVANATAAAELDERIVGLYSSLGEDLEIAAERAQSSRVTTAVARVRQAALDWNAERARVASSGATLSDWKRLDEFAEVAEQQIDLLVNYTAGDGFKYRQSARGIVATDISLSIAGTALAALISAAIAWLLCRQIIGSVASASAFAKRIAQGHLDDPLPSGGGDELGALIASMGVMRDNIRVMMCNEVAQRRSAQTRLADALEASHAGFFFIGADGRVLLSNSRSVEFFSGAGEVCKPGCVFGNLSGPLVAPILSATNGTFEARLDDGRWVRASRSVTKEGEIIAICSDISELKEQELLLKEANAILDAALSNMTQGLCMFDENQRLRLVNRRFGEIFGARERDLPPGLSIEEVAARCLAARSLATGEDWLRAPLAGKPGDFDQPRYIQIAGDRVVSGLHKGLEGGGWVSTFEDVTESKATEREIRFLATHDALTRLANRRLLEEKAEAAIAEMGRGKGFGLFCLDLDGFKEVNDTYGHPVGDQLLQQVAQRLSACAREVDTVCRLGGDEFAILQWSVEGPDDANRLAERVISALSTPFHIQNLRVLVGASIGIAMAPVDGSQFPILLKKADTALYHAKKEARGTWRFFDEQMASKLRKSKNLEAELRSALERDEFELFYQPLYDLASKRICAFEALLRWRHPVRGVISPLDFIALCESSGLIVPIGEMVLRAACKEASAWPRDIKVAVNISAVQFQSPRLFESVRNALAAAALPANRLELEITESVLLNNADKILETLLAFRALGCRISMDDFGTGYSSLSYLRQFPFDKIKIDRCFVGDLESADHSRVIVRTILGLGKNLGIDVTAEGVETREQLEWLEQAGCREAQGYLFSPPVPANEIPVLFAMWSKQSVVQAFPQHLVRRVAND